jgi:hypothetical protein
MGRAGFVFVTVALLLVAAALAVIVLRDDHSSPTPAGSKRAAALPPAGEASPSRTFVIRRRGGVPAAWAARLRETPGVTAVARTARSQLLLRRTTGRGGRVVQAARSGYAFPLDVLVVRPRAYARVLSAEAARTMRRLRPGTAVLSRTSSRLREVGVGGRLSFSDGRRLRVVGIVDDDVVRTAELVVGPRDAANAGSRAAQLVVTTTRPQRMEAALPSDVRIRSLTGGPQSSRGGIARPAELKVRFGEFAVRLPYGEDWIGIDPGWLRRNIVTRSVPILGRVTCNRRFIGPLRRALGNLERRGLSGAVDRGDFAGCYAPRRIPGSGSLSLHAWGLAIDLNASSNPQFGSSRNDPRLVRAMERAGFTWGGRWPTAPDPMHFELQGD